MSTDMRKAKLKKLKYSTYIFFLFDVLSLFKFLNIKSINIEV